MTGTAHVLVFLISVQVAWVQGSSTWGYTGSIGPSYWSSNYADCSGTQQSPININTVEDVTTSFGSFAFTGYSTNPTSYTLTNNGHTLGVTVSGTLTVSGGGFTGTKNVHSFHFHWGSSDTVGSEHTVNGVQYPMEMHIVHYDSSYPNLTSAAAQPKGLAVLGFFFEIQAADNTALDPIVNKISSVVNNGDTASVTPFPLDNLLPSAMTDFFRYDGSLTTPGCFESVVWTVFNTKINISATQLAKFRTIKFADGTFQQNNFRPVQPIGGRTVYSSFNSNTGVVAQPQLLLIATLSAAILFFQKDC